MSIKHQFKYPLDAPERTLEHREIIKNKLFLRKLYLEWYAEFSKEIKNNKNGIFIELGSGGGFLKEIEPGVICSDVLPLPTNDLSFSALDMPFEDKSIDGIFMIDTFHHIPDSEKFLSEAQRILKKGGKIIMIEPANSWWGRFIYKNFHHEPFYPEGDWKIPNAGPLSGANGALPWIVFERDQKMLAVKIPELKIESIKYHTPLRYLISGGLSIKQLVPGFSYNAFRLLDYILSNISRQLSMFVTITIKYQ
ncbi:MAG: class I SAM-dependent methyltransferase [Bacteroidota bacterium]